MSLENLFRVVEKKSHDLRKKNPNADGLKFWKPIKNELSKYDDLKASQWKRLKKEYMDVMNIPEYTIDGYGNQSIIEINHFLIQTVRIPLNEEPSLRKIIQIALNIGQYTGCGGKKEKWMNLESYLTKKDIRKLDSQIPDDLLINIKNII